MSYVKKTWTDGDYFTPQDATSMSSAIKDNEDNIIILVGGLATKQDAITSQNLLDADYVTDETSTHKFVTQAQKVKLDNAYGPAYVGKDTSANILAKSSNTGIWKATDNNHWYYWNGTQYTDGGLYLSTGNVVTHSGNQLKDDNGNNIYPLIYRGKLENIDLRTATLDYGTYNIYPVSTSNVTGLPDDYDGTRYGIVLCLFNSCVILIQDVEKGYWYKTSNNKWYDINDYGYFTKSNAILDLIYSGSLNGAYSIKTIDVETTLLSGKGINSATGYLFDISGDTTYKVIEVNVNENEMYYVNGNANYQNGIVTFYDVNNVAIYPVGKGGTGSTYLSYNKLIVTPKNAKKMYVAYNSNTTTGYVYKAELKQNTELTNFIDTFTIFNRINGIETQSRIIHNGNLINAGANEYCIKTYTITGGKEYKINACANFGNQGYAFYDENDIYISGSTPAASGSAVTYFNDDVIAPLNATKLIIAYYTDYLYGYVEEQQYGTPKKWVGKKWVCIGDSLTEVNSRTTTHYFDYVSDDTGISVVNLGISGTGYMRHQEDNQAFYQRVSSIPLDADVITIFGSGNDLGGGYTMGEPSDTGTTTICGCINTTLDNILDRFLTNGKLPVIGVITPTPWIGSEPSNPNNQFSQYCNNIIECCRRKSIPVLDLYRESNLHPDNATFRQLAYSRDDGSGVHPDENGHKIIAPMFKSLLEKLII